MIMTIKEFYEWAVARGVENYTLSVNYRDGGGWYSGCEEAAKQISPLKKISKKL